MMGVIHRVYPKFAGTLRHDGVSALLWEQPIRFGSPLGDLGLQTLQVGATGNARIDAARVLPGSGGPGALNAVD